MITQVWVRGGFFTIYLACIISELEEFQVMRFILGLKGTQFISGLFKFVKLAFAFWGCSVTSTDPAGCSAAGPGVGHTSVLKMISAIVFLQVNTPRPAFTLTLSPTFSLTLLSRLLSPHLASLVASLCRCCCGSPS